MKLRRSNLIEPGAVRRDSSGTDTVQQVECWFSILSRGALQGTSFTSVRMLVQAMEAFIGHWNQNAAPFEWTKHEVQQQEMKRSYADLCN